MRVLSGVRPVECLPPKLASCKALAMHEAAAARNSERAVQFDSASAHVSHHCALLSVVRTTTTATKRRRRSTACLDLSASNGACNIALAASMLPAAWNQDVGLDPWGRWPQNAEPVLSQNGYGTSEIRLCGNTTILQYYSAITL